MNQIHLRVQCDCTMNCPVGKCLAMAVEVDVTVECLKCDFLVVFTLDVLDNRIQYEKNVTNLVERHRKNCPHTPIVYDCAAHYC